MSTASQNSFDRLHTAIFKNPAARAGYTDHVLNSELVKTIHKIRVEKGLKVHHLRRLWSTAGRAETHTYRDVMGMCCGEIGDYLLLGYLLGYQLEFSLRYDPTAQEKVVITTSYSMLL